MSEITMQIPDEALHALRVAPERMGAEVRIAAAVKLYELGRLSSGSAAQLAGVSRPEFLIRLAEYGVAALAGDPDDLNRETRLA